jgi:hypothetical protein
MCVDMSERAQQFLTAMGAKGPSSENGDRKSQWQGIQCMLLFLCISLLSFFFLLVFPLRMLCVFLLNPASCVSRMLWFNLLDAWFIGPEMNQDSIRRSIGNAASVIIFNDFGIILSPFHLSSFCSHCRFQWILRSVSLEIGSNESLDLRGATSGIPRRCLLQVCTCHSSHFCLPSFIIICIYFYLFFFFVVFERYLFWFMLSFPLPVLVYSEPLDWASFWTTWRNRSKTSRIPSTIVNWP